MNKSQIFAFNIDFHSTVKLTKQDFVLQNQAVHIDYNLKTNSSSRVKHDCIVNQQWMHGVNK